VGSSGIAARFRILPQGHFTSKSVAGVGITRILTNGGRALFVLRAAALLDGICLPL
jgi:hypothetical protein